MIKVTDVKVLMIDNEDFGAFVVMMKKLAIAFNLLTQGQATKIVAVHSSKLEYVLLQWGNRGFKYEWVEK